MRLGFSCPFPVSAVPVLDLISCSSNRVARQSARRSCHQNLLITEGEIKPPVGKAWKVLYNRCMKNIDIAYHLKGRWKNIKQKENEVLRISSPEVRFWQTSALMDFTRTLGPSPEDELERRGVMETWKKLKARLG